MNKLSRNIVYVGNDSYYKGNLKLCDVKNKKNQPSNKNVRFPHLVQVNNIEDLKRKQGFLLVLTIDDLCYYLDTIDIYKPDVYEIDRHIRKKFKNFQYVIIISIEEFDYGHIPFSNIYVEFANKYFNNNEGLNILIDKLYEEYMSLKKIKLSKIKKENIEKLRTYLRKKKKEFITTKEIMEDLNVNEKWIQRYMKEMNNIYHNIGYSKIKRVWYVVKNNYKK